MSPFYQIWSSVKNSHPYRTAPEQNTSHQLISRAFQMFSQKKMSVIRCNYSSVGVAVEHKEDSFLLFYNYYRYEYRKSVFFGDFFNFGKLASQESCHIRSFFWFFLPIFIFTDASFINPYVRMRTHDPQLSYYPSLFFLEWLVFFMCKNFLGLNFIIRNNK